MNIGRSALVLVLVIFSYQNNNAQTCIDQVDIQSKDYVILALDPDSPIRLEEPTLSIRHDNGASENGFTARNVSNLRIKRFVVWNINWLGGNEYRNLYEFRPDQELGPGMTYTKKVEAEVAGINLGKSKESSVEIGGKQKRIWILMVTNVEFVDGTRYDAFDRFKALEKYLKELDKDFRSDEEASTLERKLCQFVRNRLFARMVSRGNGEIGVTNGT